ncbi:hypothetical protein ASE12_14180 [Aeromicrobium sp. Root236]|uniref:LysR substrate-binding domain-containing protein n=1 Tax=Aeromicrobium sp. Root236 TaxID=1736498 RepID=UPI0006F6D958|nr:LysR substrate-binding domain-containing protein [Aeromicrobium sp. Root236]KRC65803.1 hypothetical protein ASE12_14180 [Aeromicrobium sp. Root236]
MDVRQLEAFLAVAEHLHFGHAAEQLFMAPAPLSRTIQSLEKDLGAKLFIRNTRTVVLTPAGYALIHPAREVIDAVQRAEEIVQAAVTGEIGSVRIEFSGLASRPIVAELARRMRSDHAGIKLELSSLPLSRPSMQRLVVEKIDIALGRWDQVPPGVSTQILQNDSLAIVLPRGHRLAAAEFLSFRQVADEPFVSLPYVGGSVTTDRLWRLGYAHGVKINNVQFAPDTQSCIALVSAEVGCHLALGSVGRWTSNDDVVFVPLDPADSERVPDVHLRTAWRANGATLAVQAALAHLVKLAEPDVVVSAALVAQDYPEN